MFQQKFELWYVQRHRGAIPRRVVGGGQWNPRLLFAMEWVVWLRNLQHVALFTADRGDLCAMLLAQLHWSSGCGSVQNDHTKSILTIQTLTSVRIRSGRPILRAKKHGDRRQLSLYYYKQEQHSDY